jgi:FKBP-type peptidyl-prolyl cis-trans isomerase
VKRPTFVLTLVVGLLLAGTLAAPAANPETDDQKTLYALGQVLAQRINGLGLTEEEVAYIQDGLSDSVLGRDSKAPVETWRAKIDVLLGVKREAMAAVEKDAGDAFVAEAAKAAGAVKTASGAIYLETLAGSGAQPAVTDTVKLHYHGTLRDGTVFDSSVVRGQPASFSLNRVIPCWTEAVQKMRVGGKAKIVCPPDIAYGDRGAGALIRPGAVLTFEVELISIDSR